MHLFRRPNGFWYTWHWENGKRVWRSTNQHSRQEAIKRKEDMNCSGIYTFWLNDEHAIDGYGKGNHTKYLNHSSDPSCSYEIAGNKILFYAARDIHQDEELMIDYDYNADSELIVCLCGSDKC